MQDEDLRDDKVEFDRQLLIKQKRARELRLDAFGARQHNLAWDQKQKAQRMRDRLAAMRKGLSFASWEDSGRGVLNGANNLGLSLYNFAGRAVLGTRPSSHLNLAWDYDENGWSMDEFGDHDTFLGPFIADAVQFAGGFTKVKAGYNMAKWPLKKMLTQRGRLSKMPLKSGKPEEVRRFWSTFFEGAVAGAATDFIVWDPTQPNLLGGLLDTAKKFGWDKRMNGWDKFMEDYAGAMPEQYGGEHELDDHFRIRFANVAEGVLMGGMLNMLWKGVKFARIQHHYDTASRELGEIEAVLQKMTPEEIRRDPTAYRALIKDRDGKTVTWYEEHDKMLAIGKGVQEAVRNAQRYSRNSTNWVGPNKKLDPTPADPMTGYPTGERGVTWWGFDPEVDVATTPYGSYGHIGENPSYLRKVNLNLDKVDAEISLKQAEIDELKAAGSPHTAHLEHKLDELKKERMDWESDRDLFDITNPTLKEGASSGDVIAWDYFPEATGANREKLKKQKWEEGRVAQISEDGSQIFLDRRAISEDWDHGAPFLTGRRLVEGSDHRAGQITKAGWEEVEIFQLMNIDPTHIVRKIKERVARMEPDPESQQRMGGGLYQKFFELRLRHLNKLAQEQGIPLGQISPHTGHTMDLLMESTYNTLFKSADQGGLGFKKSDFRSDVTEPVIAKFPEITRDELDGILFKADPATGRLVGLEGLVNNIQAAVKGEVDFNEVLDNIANGQFFNPHTHNYTPQSKDAMSGLIQTFQEIFQRQFPKMNHEQAFAKLNGWTGLDKDGVGARKYNITHIADHIEVLAESAGVPPAEMWELVQSGNLAALTGFSGSLRNLGLKDPLGMGDKFAFGDVRDMHVRIMGIRSFLDWKLNGLHAWQQKIWKKTEGMNADKVHLITNEDRLELGGFLEELMTDFGQLATASHASGQNLQAFGRWAQMKSLMEKLRPTDILSPEATANVDAILSKGLVGDDDAVNALVNAIQLAKADGKRILTKDVLEKNLREIRILQETRKADSVAMVAELMISGMLSAVATHSLNLGSSIAMSFFHRGFRAIGTTVLSKRLGDKKAFRGHKLFKKLASRTRSDITPDQATRFARFEALKGAWFQGRVLADMLRFLVRTSTDEHFVTSVRHRNQQLTNAGDDIESVFRADVDPSGGHVMGSSKMVELEGSPKDTRGYDADAIGAQFKRWGEWGGGEWMHNQMREFGKRPMADAFGAVWNGLYHYILRQPIRKMVSFDQFVKYSVVRSSTEATLAAYGRHVMGIPRYELSNFVMKASKGIVRPGLEGGFPGGQLFSRAALKAEAEHLLEFNIRKDPSASNRLSPGDREKYIEDYIQKEWDLKDADGRVTVSGEVREFLANEAFDDAQYVTFQRRLDHDRKRHAKLSKEASVKSTARLPMPAPTKETTSIVEAFSETTQTNPWLKIILPFITTPWNLAKVTHSMAPAFGQNAKINQADMLSSAPRDEAAARGRRAVGVAFFAAAFEAVRGGYFTGGGSKDPRRRNVEKGMGHENYVFVFPDGGQLDMSRLEPWITPFKLAANVHENMEYVRNDPKADSVFMEHAGAVVSATLETFTDSTYLRTVGELGLLWHQMADEDNRKNAVENFLKNRARGFTPRALSQFPRAIDTTRRSTKDALRSDLENKLYPWGAPPMRDPLFGYVQKYHPRMPNRFIQMVLPIKFTQKHVVSPVYQEMHRIHGLIARRNPRIDGGEMLNGARHYTNFEWPEGKQEHEDMYRALAKTFRAPGGASCPIFEHQSYDDFEQQYIGLRKEKWNKVDKIKEWKLSIPEEWDKKSEGYKKLIKVFDGILKDNRFDQEVDLETLLLGLIASPEYNAFDKDPSKVSRELSYCRELIASEISVWRNKARKELWGEPEDMERAIGAPVDEHYGGIVSRFWPVLASKRILLRNERSKQKNEDPNKVNPLIQEQRDRDLKREERELELKDKN